MVSLWPAHPQWWLRLCPTPHRPRNRCVLLSQLPQATCPFSGEASLEGPDCKLPMGGGVAGPQDRLISLTGMQIICRWHHSCLQSIGTSPLPGSKGQSQGCLSTRLQDRIKRQLFNQLLLCNWDQNTTVSFGWHQFSIPVSPCSATEFHREVFRRALLSVYIERHQGRGGSCRQILRDPPSGEEGKRSQQRSFPRQVLCSCPGLAHSVTARETKGC